MKYAVYTKWHWPSGVLSKEKIHDFHRQLKSEGTTAEDIIWWVIDDNHHQSLVVYPSIIAAEAEKADREADREDAANSRDLVLLEETMGPIYSQLSQL